MTAEATSISTSAIALDFRSSDTAPRGPISFAIDRCIEGQVLVARSSVGLCAIFLDDDVDALVRQLREAFPGRVIERAQQDLQGDLDDVVAFVDGSASQAALRLDVGGSPFQRRVWAALCDIPAGETRTYTEIAGSIGAPDAVRAVAGACAANRLAVVVPCHRVVRSDGEISGYRWGVERKRALLARESA
ncbi:MAG: methylated-DNA--[protein]-cysteine S-methyltransferase [Rubrivivax sp.]|nr:MAG: methylated-DNA--[protein]-cysteine S-methyltransferase [Rubrivivax sp.]